ncbi:EAL domain-containing protein [Vibrio sinaloensis]|nr:EAL domain-containing protein [Vibrio sinaloensis]
MCSKLDVVCGYEALMRWIKPDGTTISPIDFIPVAEQSNKITSITEWVLDKVAQDIQQFFSAWPALPHTRQPIRKKT